MSFLNTILNDLRAKRLWPVAALLLIAVVAAPIVLSKSASSSPAPVADAPSSGSGAASGLPAVSVSSTPSEGELPGKSHDPFSQASGSTTSTGTTSSTTPTKTGTGSSAGGSSSKGSGSGSGTSGGGTGSSSGGSTTSGTSSSGTPSITNPKPPPAPPGLSATESYEVSLAITNPAGGLNTYSPLQRLSVLPGPSRALVAELGVLKGGKRVLFSVQPGAILDGPGSCVPGPVDCEIVSLAPGETEALGMQTSRGPRQVALFAVTGVTAGKHSSVAGADQARRSASAVGRALLADSTSSALSLFAYKPSVGALVDLRNLTVGG
jgi:hypothetical protein